MRKSDAHEVPPMMGNAFSKVRSFVIRSLAVGAVVLTYAFGGIITQVATAVGVSGVLLTSTKPAEAQWRRRRWRRYRGYRGYYVPRRRYYRRYYVPRRRYYRRWRRR